MSDTAVGASSPSMYDDEAPAGGASRDAAPQGTRETGDRKAHERRERPAERADRNMIELLQELRVAQTGVQILFAFLLSLTFTERFVRIDEFQRWTYVVTLLLTTLTTGLLVAPAAIHRMLFGQGVKAVTVSIGHRLFVSGLATLTLTLVGVVLLVLDIAVGRTFAWWTAGVVGVVLAGLWFVLPLPVRARNDQAEDDQAQDTVRSSSPGADGDDVQ